jgi:hypothetical protein
MSKPCKATQLVLILLLTYACSKDARVSYPPWDSSLEPFFDDSFEIVGDVTRLKGQWADEQMDRMKGRAANADFVAETRIVSVRTITDTDRMETKTVQVRFTDVLYGTAPDETMEIHCSGDTVGFEQLKSYEKTDLIEQPYYLFIKWYENDAEIFNHFHFTIADPSIEVLVETLVEKRLAEEGKKKEPKFQMR